MTGTPEPFSTPVAFSLGANLGQPEKALGAAVERLREELAEVRVSSLYQTEPISAISQPEFYNLAVVGRAALSPRDLLELIRRLEKNAGRTRGGPPDGPRTLDIDLLLFGEETSADPELTLPHPRMRTRRFVLEPLAEIAPDLPVPPDGATVAQILARLPAGGAVRRIQGS